MPGNWEGSHRREQLPPGWETRIRPAIIARDSGRCRWIENNRRCPEPGTDVDHVGDPHDHSLANLRLLCRTHHNRRSSRQGNDAQRARRLRNVEPHPALS
jgi:5-methylcytosine-specific restriction protein A